MISKNYDAILDIAHEHCLHTQAQIDSVKSLAKETYKKLTSMSWQELVENRAALGTTMVLDMLALNALTSFANTTGRAAVKQLSNAMKKGTALTKQYTTEVAGFEKLIIEEGPEAAQKEFWTILQRIRIFFIHPQNYLLKK